MGYSTAKKNDTTPNPAKLTKRLFLRWLMLMLIFMSVMSFAFWIWDYAATAVHVKRFLGYEFGQKCVRTTDPLIEPWCDFSDVTLIPYHGSLMTLEFGRKIYGPTAEKEAMNLAEVIEKKYGVHFRSRWSSRDLVLEYPGRKTYMNIYLFNEGDYHYYLSFSISDAALLNERKSDREETRSEKIKRDIERLD